MAYDTDDAHYSACEGAAPDATRQRLTKSLQYNEGYPGSFLLILCFFVAEHREASLNTPFVFDFSLSPEARLVSILGSVLASGQIFGGGEGGSWGQLRER